MISNLAIRLANYQGTHTHTDFKENSSFPKALVRHPFCTQHKHSVNCFEGNQENIRFLRERKPFRKWVATCVELFNIKLAVFFPFDAVRSKCFAALKSINVLEVWEIFFVSHFYLEKNIISSKINWKIVRIEADALSIHSSKIIAHLCQNIKHSL